jgi:hypothetical protein
MGLSSNGSGDFGEQEDGLASFWGGKDIGYKGLYLKFLEIYKGAMML